MKHHPPRVHSVLLACCLAAGVAAVQAQETSQTTPQTPTSTSSAIGTSTHTESKLAAEFAAFLGGEAQARSLVSGLRQGTAFTLETTTSTTATSGTTTTTTRIGPPTGTMGYGNIRIALRLAQAQLNDLGMAQPTTEELSAVLLGGEINGTPIDGILTLRADGMGWGQIARQYGTTVGQLMGKGSVHAKQSASLPPAKSAGKTTATASATGKTGNPPKAHANGYIPSGKGAGGGYMTGAGYTVSASETGNGKGQTQQTSAKAHGAGMASTGGPHAALAGVSHAGGGSSASAPGQIRKN